MSSRPSFIPGRPETGGPRPAPTVILNLVVNGIDAIANMPNGVREIACRSGASDGPARPGLPLDRSFEPLFTTKQEGMGKGLCITHAVIESHGGKVSAKKRCQRRRFSREPAPRHDGTIDPAVAGARPSSHPVAQRSLRFSKTVSTAWIRRSDGNGLCRYATQPA